MVRYKYESWRDLMKNNEPYTYEEYLEWDREYREYIENKYSYTYKKKNNSNINDKDVKWEPGF